MLIISGDVGGGKEKGKERAGKGKKRGREREGGGKFARRRVYNKYELSVNYTY